MTVHPQYKIGSLGWLIPGVLSTLLLNTPVKAGSITEWHFDANRNQLDLKTDEDIQPKVQLLSNPSRLVIDLPGTVLGYPKQIHSVNSRVQEIRIGQFDPDTARVVIALAPGYTLDPSQIKVRGESPEHWIVQLPQPQYLAQGNAFDLPQQSVGQTVEVVAPEQTRSFGPAPNIAAVLPLGEPMAQLQAQIKMLMGRYGFLQTGMFFLDLDNGNYLDIRGNRVFPAASTIKLPILIAFLQDLDAGRVSLQETLIMRQDLITGGSGDMQDLPVGSRFTALKTLQKMIIISDNTATNMIIDRLGGISRLNQRFRSWGLQDTVIRHWLADLSGTNTTSSRDMVQVLALLVNDKLVSPRSKELALSILRQTTIKTLLPAGLGRGAVIADKTGDIGFLIGDAGLIEMPSGKRYLGGIFVKRPYDDVRGRIFIQQVSRLVYNYLSQPASVSSVYEPKLMP